MSNSTDFPIDLYIPFVDGNDPEYVQSMIDCARGMGEDQDDDETTGMRRINNFGQLRLALRSVYFCLPWIRNVHVVFHSPRQIPAWLNRENDCLKVHFHKDYFDPEIPLPTFSSFVIDTQMGRVPGLSEHFIYLEDDEFFCQVLQRTDFFSETGKPLIDYVVNPEGMVGWIDPQSYRDQGTAIWPNVYKFANFIWKTLLHNNDMSEICLVDDHRPLPFIKSVFKQTNSAFPNIYRYGLTQRFRRSNVLSMYAYLWGMVWNDRVGETSHWSLLRENFPGLLPDGVELSSYYSGCINDQTSFSSEQERLVGTREYTRAVENLMGQLFPQASEFETD